MTRGPRSFSEVESSWLIRLSLPVLFAVALVGGVSSVAPTAHAQTATDNCLTDGAKYGCDSDQVCKGSPIPTCQTNSALDGTVAAGGACTQDAQCADQTVSTGTVYFGCVDSVCTEEAVGEGQPCLTENGCTDNLTCTGNVCKADTDTTAAASNNAATKTPSDFSNNKDGMLAWIMVEIMKLFAWLLGIAALTLDNAMYYCVVHMGDYVNGLSAVGVAWRILRDIGNIVLIFGFIALGISVILDADWYGGGTKMLPKLLMAAVFLNFSLFAAEAVVDVGNLFATEFYTQINNGQAASAPAIASVSNIASEPISYTILNQLGFQTIYGNSINGSVNSGLTESNIFVIGFMAILLFIIAAFVFFSLAFILIARFVVLILIIIVAPIGIAGLAVPKLDTYASRWWNMLFQQTLTAPAMLLMLYIALAVITDSKFLTGFTSSSATGTSASNAMQNAWTTWSGDPTKIGSLGAILLSFIVAMALLYAVVLLSKQMGAMGGDLITKNIKRAGAAAGLAGLGLATYPGRRAARGATYLGGKELERLRTTKAGSWIARRALPALTLGGVGNIDVQKAAENMQKVKYGTRYSEKELVDFEKKDKPLRESEQRKRDAQGAIDEGISNAENAKTDADRDAANDQISRALKTLSDKEIAELQGVKTGVNKLVTNLSPQQFESLMKSDTLSEAQKGAIKTERYRDLGGAITAAKAGNKDPLFKVLGGLSKGELETMPAEMLATPEVLENLTDKQRETLTDGKERTAAEKAKIRGNSKSGMLEAEFKAQGGAVAAARLARMSPQQVAKLPKEILTDTEIAKKLTPAQLSAIQKEDKLDQNQIKLIKDAVGAGGLPASQAHVINALNAWYWS